MMDAGGYAAWAAAVTSVATLVVTTVVGGRREKRQWARGALTDAFVAFLSASWQHSDLAKVSATPPDISSAEAMDAQYGEMRNQLTRLRLLSPPDVVRAGEALLRLQRRVKDAGSASERAEALAAASTGRHDVVSAAQKAMGLRRPWGAAPRGLRSPSTAPGLPEPRQPSDSARTRADNIS
ncbi:hypothetical protein ACIPJN_19440 [Streptomyces sp. NPDC086796]|uniref:hypothetical protein n=1 Tax=unclassified Streptomyces TaxID=2593676 RepID=UPI0038166FFD